MISAPAGHPGDVRVIRTWTSPASSISTSYTRPISMILRLSSGSLTARIAFRMASAVGIEELPAIGYRLSAIGYRLSVPNEDNDVERSALRHQVLLAGMGDQAD